MFADHDQAGVGIGLHGLNNRVVVSQQLRAHDRPPTAMCCEIATDGAKNIRISLKALWVVAGWAISLLSPCNHTRYLFSNIE
jgi:hypothetical protein